MSGRNESKADKEKQKQIQDKCQSVLNQLLRDEDNKYCVDCDAKGPRWASWNLGVFLCIRCAGIHRNLGVHISKVRSVNLDTWTPEQVVSLQQMGNSRARAVYEATLPDTWRRPQNDSSLETFIRAKYQHKKYIAKEWVPPVLPKVNWEKEIEEEAEKQKRKKKEKQQQLTSALPPVKKVDVAVPALPKPSNSPKSNRAISAASVDKQSSSAAVDLLGLTTGPTSNGDSEDVFSSFLSAPVVSASPAPQVASKENETKELNAEEDSFFNQPATSVVSDPKKPLSKDSIMALYSSQAPTPPQPTMFHTAGMFPPNPPMGFPGATNTGFPVPPNTGFAQPGNAMFAPPGSAGFATTGFPSGFMSAPPMAGFPAPFANGIQAIPSAGPNPFMGMSMAMAPPHGFPAQHGSQSKPSDDLLADFSTTTNLPDQMAGLNLGGMGPAPGAVMGGFPSASPFAPMNQRPPATMTSMGQTFTTQLWQ